MRKHSTTSWRKRLMVMVAAVLVAMGAAKAATPVALSSTFSVADNVSVISDPVDFNKFTLTPEGPYEEIWGLTYTWDYPVQILDASLIYIQAPDYTEYTGGNGLSCSVQGNSLIIDVVNGPLKNHTAYEAWTWIGIREGAIAVNGQTLNETLEQMITWQPGGTVIPDPVTVPAWGTTAYTSEINEIILSWPGFCVASDTGNKLLSNLDDDIEIWVGPKGVKYDGGSGYTKLAVKSVEGVGTPTQKVWYPSMKVTLSQPFTDADKGLTLVIPSWNLLFTEEGDGDTYESQPERIDLYFCVAKDIVLPGQMQRMNYNAFKGLEIKGGNYTVKDASKIALYKGWFDEVDFKIADSTPIAYGVNNSTSDEIIIGFDTDYSKLWSGAYTILVPPGAIEGFTVAKGTESANPENQIQFTITGNNAPITAMALGTSPEPGVVDQIDKVQIWWGGYNRLMHATNPEDPETGAGSAIVNGTMSVNGGEPTDIAFVITKKLIETAQDEDTGQGDGVDYEYSLVYKPSTPITAPGKYTFTLPANQVRVYYNSFSEPLNDEVVLEYTIEGQTPEPEPVYMIGANIDPANKSHMDNMGIVTITWPQYRLDLGNTPDRTAVNLPTDKIKVYLNGEELNPSSLMGMDWKALNAATTNEGAGGTDEYPLAEILFYPGNACFFWSGTLNIKIDEGVVTTTNGEINPAFDLTYYLGGKDVISPCVFDPEDGAIFYVSEDNKVTMSWPEVYNDNGSLYHGAYQATGIEAGKAFYDTYDEDGNRTRIDVPNGAMTIVEGNVVLDISDLPVGVYSLTVGQGAILLGEDAINAEIYYNFSIEEKEVPTDPTESDIDPTITLDQEKNVITISYDGNDLEITDDWSLTITDSEGNVTNVPADKVSIDDQGNLMIDLSELGIKGDGDYTLILGENSVLIDEDGTTTYNPELVYTFKTTAIGILTADESKSWKVYDMNGVNVLGTDNATDLNQLEKGLYIINGKKVLVK